MEIVLHVHACCPSKCHYMPKGPGSGQHREVAVGTWEVGGSEATSAGGDACGTSTSKCSVEPEMERGSSWLGQIVGKSQLRYKGVCSVPGEQDCLFVDTLKKPQSRSSHTNPG